MITIKNSLESNLTQVLRVSKLKRKSKNFPTVKHREIKIWKRRKSDKEMWRMDRRGPTYGSSEFLREKREKRVQRQY